MDAMRGPRHWQLPARKRLLLLRASATAMSNGHAHTKTSTGIEFVLTVCFSVLSTYFTSSDPQWCWWAQKPTGKKYMRSEAFFCFLLSIYIQQTQNALGPDIWTLRKERRWVPLDPTTRPALQKLRSTTRLVGPSPPPCGPCRRSSHGARGLRGQDTRCQAPAWTLDQGTCHFQAPAGRWWGPLLALYDKVAISWLLTWCHSRLLQVLPGPGSWSPAEAGHTGLVL